jgi:hypothetical protein
MLNAKEGRECGGLASQAVDGLFSQHRYVWLFQSVIAERLEKFTIRDTNGQDIRNLMCAHAGRLAKMRVDGGDCLSADGGH